MAGHFVKHEDKSRLKTKSEQIGRTNSFTSTILQCIKSSFTFIFHSQHHGEVRNTTGSFCSYRKAQPKKFLRTPSGGGPAESAAALL
ncbi:hypothetical protein OUZ56_001584 [Daphnia magna]|uniref:Uncharacterized protein n=1 Tax=Daphnia magna TaxID=35525 RepID=A0ABR0A3K9_9CRUS|nr:hypothetical protein OUZ56_001584 [Daphnia magna]